MQVNPKDQQIQSIVRGAFPDYNGRDVNIKVASFPMHVDSYWTEGSRNYFEFVELATGRNVGSVRSNHPGYEADRPNKVNDLPDGIAIVEKTIYRGKTLGITIHVKAENMNRLALPEPASLTWAETVCLYATRCYKSTYGGIKNYRLKESEGSIRISLRRNGRKLKRH